jgi:hypothetical protein
MLARVVPEVARFTIERDTGLHAAEAWRRLTDWQLHGDFIPFTTVTRAGVGVGSSFTARTSLGPLGFDDPMHITVWRPPDADTVGHCRIEKRGRVITGWAELTVAPTPTGSRVRWGEAASIRHTGKVLDRPSRLVSRWMFGRLVDRLLAD